MIHCKTYINNFTYKRSFRNIKASVQYKLLENIFDILLFGDMILEVRSVTDRKLSCVPFFLLGCRVFGKNRGEAREHWRSQEMRTSGFSIVAVLGEERGPHLRVFVAGWLVKVAFPGSPLRHHCCCSSHNVCSLAKT